MELEKLAYFIPLLRTDPEIPELVFGWPLMIGTFFAILGASLGSVGGVGGGGIFVPMLMIVLGFDAKTAPAVSKCMIFSQCISTVVYNLRLKRASGDGPLIDYDMALLFQPMLLLGIGLGVSFNVIFPEWLITLLLIVLTLAVASRGFWRGMKTWKKETLQKNQEAEARAKGTISSEGRSGGDSPIVGESIWTTVQWSKLFVLLLVWIGIALSQYFKAQASKCSVAFWIFNMLQVPVTFAVTITQAIRLRNMNVKRREALLDLDQESSSAIYLEWGALDFLRYAVFGIMAGALAGLLGIGGGATIGPLMLEFGISPQVVSSTAILIMSFSSSLTVVEFYLLGRIPVDFALYFAVVCVLSAYFSQRVLQKLINMLGRSSVIIFCLVFVIFVGGVTLGGVGIFSAIGSWQRGEYMGFSTLCVE